MSSHKHGVPVRHVLLCLFLVGSLSSARAETHVDSTVGDSAEIHRPILDGKPSTIQQVVQLQSVYPDGRKGSCSGTVVSETDILTAAHCIHDGAQMSVVIPGKGSAPLTCHVNSEYPKVSPEAVKATDQARAVATKACEEAKANPGNPQSEAAVQQADSRYKEVRKASIFASPEQVAKDLAICKVSGGKFSVMPAKVAPVDQTSTRYLAVGYGFSAQSTSGQSGAGNQRSGQMTFSAEARPGIIRTEYRSGDPQKQSVSFGDSGGPLLAMSGGGVKISGVATGFTSAGPQELDRATCRYVYRGASQGVNLFADLSSPFSKRFFAEAQSKGFRIEGATPDSGQKVAKIGGDAKQSTPASYTASGSPQSQTRGVSQTPRVASTNSRYPEIQIGVPHAPPAQGQVYKIGDRLWKYKGGGEWLPAQAVGL